MSKRKLSNGFYLRKNVYGEMSLFTPTGNWLSDFENKAKAVWLCRKLNKFLRELGVLLLCLCLNACSSIEQNKSMLVALDYTYVDDADMIPLQFELNREPRWVNQAAATEQTTHILHAKTVCRKDASKWVPYKWIKECTQYLQMADAATKAILYQANYNGTHDFKDALTWEDVVKLLYEEYRKKGKVQND